MPPICLNRCIYIITAFLGNIQEVPGLSLLYWIHTGSRLLHKKRPDYTNNFPLSKRFKLPLQFSSGCSLSKCGQEDLLSLVKLLENKSFGLWTGMENSLFLSFRKRLRFYYSQKVKTFMKKKLQNLVSWKVFTESGIQTSLYSQRMRLSTGF